MATTSTTGTKSDPVRLTEPAARKIRALLAKEGLSLDVGGFGLASRAADARGFPTPCVWKRNRGTETRFSRPLVRGFSWIRRVLCTSAEPRWILKTR